MHSPKSFRRSFARLWLAGIVLLKTGSALARPEIPGEIQAAADMQCVPLCTLCHMTNPGQANNWTKPLGAALFAPIKAQTDIKPAYDAWALMFPAEAAKVKAGIEPGAGNDICGPTYGCGAHVVKEAAAPRDFTGPLWVVGAVVAGGLLRRRRRPNVE
jgi:MYXO-CTERM domain-containing protein